jgi:hypothetical protein
MKPLLKSLRVPNRYILCKFVSDETITQEEVLTSTSHPSHKIRTFNLLSDIQTQIGILNVGKYNLSYFLKLSQHPYVCIITNPKGLLAIQQALTKLNYIQTVITTGSLSKVKEKMTKPRN